MFPFLMDHCNLFEQNNGFKKIQPALTGTAKRYRP